ncbi:MAG TPA: creatininase family protein [bacterium]|nr:creatininase family protein [bacterium]
MEKKRNLHRWEELFPQEFAGIMEKTPIVYFPFGLVEEHGTHLSMCPDFSPVYRMCLAAAERTGGVVYPFLPAAPGFNPPLSREEIRQKRLKGECLYKPSLFLSSECCRLIYDETLESMAGIGFKVCMAVGGHMPAILLMGRLAKEKNGEVEGMRIENIDWTDIILKSTDIGRRYPEGLAHGGIIETALVMYCDKRLCRLSQVLQVRDTNFVSQLARLSDEKLEGIRKNATISLGREIFEAAVSAIADTARSCMEKSG